MLDSKKLFDFSVENKSTPYKLGFGVILLWIINLLVALALFNGGDNGWASRGQLGDLFGVVNALFSGLAFAGIIFTIMLQKKELHLTREQLELNRTEMKNSIEEQKRSREEFEQQNITLKAQRFETSFYNLLTAHNNLINGLVVGNNPSLGYKGRDLIYLINNSIKNSLSHYKIKQTPSKQDILTMREHYNNCSKQYSGVLDMYFESLLYLFELPAHSTLIENNDRLSYIKIITAQLSPNERTLIYYFLCLAVNTGEGAYVHQHFHRLQSSYSLFTLGTNPEVYDSTHMNLMGWWNYHKDID